MKKFRTSSDIGGVLVGTKDFGVALENGYGDGTTRVYIYDCEDEFRKDAYGGWSFNKSLTGTFNIYCDDCSDRRDEDIIATLNGRYAVYYRSAEVAFVKWE